eukprot:1160284-Pelagomonas_calceolata.AAC.12
MTRLCSSLYQARCIEDRWFPRNEERIRMLAVRAITGSQHVLVTLDSCSLAPVTDARIKNCVISTA